ncbi:hypothetical protein VTN77DRAFT_355 [Rasamsonia byssochlamydoides]|uniref:uncharacterized protein n=1 Tax=Rasamsonia byssochlamydoides TaxID=89139 RepID=UPI00374336AA
MATTSKNGLCPPPFLQESLFPSSGGYIDGRFCETVNTAAGTLSCCLPCPLENWRYPDNVHSKTVAASWLAVAVLPLSAFLLITYAVLPAKWTHRNYISICFTLALCCMQIAFIIPLGTKPQQCYNEITPNDMRSSLSCAFTGAFLLFGGVAVVSWSLIRTIALHLQVCWEVIIGAKFMMVSFICGWGVPVIVLALMLIFTGVSYRFGDVCHINSPNSLGDYWIPVLVIGSLSLILQFVTLGYCIHVYVKSLFDTNPTSTTNSGLPSYSGSVRTVTARQAYKRVRRVLELQWRSIALVLTIIANVIFFAVVFVRLNNSLKPTPENLQRASKWIFCLALTRGDASQCVADADGVALNEATLLAVLVLLAVSSFWNFIFVVRWSMVQGWIDFIKGLFVQQVEFVSADARTRFPDTRTYEMLSSRQQTLKSPEPVVTSPLSTSTTLRNSDGKSSDYFGREAKYTSPAMSFSSPRPPSSQQNGRYWDPQSSFARSNSTYRQQNPRYS